MKNSANISMKEIMNRKKQDIIDEMNAAEPDDFDNDSCEYTYDDFKKERDGEIAALDDMMHDVTIMTEEDFVKKYVAIIDKREEKPDTEHDFGFIGYCNVLTEVLDLFTPGVYFQFFD